MSSLPLPVLRYRYERAAQEYLRSLPLEHFMEATPQATQRKITLESLDLVHARRPDVQLFNELLVQYPLPKDRIGQVVPDNMVVVWPEPIQAEGSYDIPLQPTGPYWVMEYVSKLSERKDYNVSFRKYERDLKVPYYLIFYPDVQEMSLFRRGKTKYVSVPEDEHGRCAIPKLDLEVGLQDGWVRYWYKGELLPLPGDLQKELDETKKLLSQERRRASRFERRAEEEARRAEEEARHAEEERQARLAAEAEVAQLKAEMERMRKNRS